MIDRRKLHDLANRILNTFLEAMEISAVTWPCFIYNDISILNVDSYQMYRLDDEQLRRLVDRIS